MFILKIVLWVVFVAASILLSIVILLQESKGGGLAEAFGGVGGETFGHRAGGINRFTFLLAGVFLGSAILLHAVRG